MSMLNNKTPLSMIAAAALASGSALSSTPRTQEFEFKPNEYMRDLFAPTLPPTPQPLEETDPKLAELIQWFEKQPQAIRRKLEVVHVAKKVGRNEPCPCGAMKDNKPVKYKKCCIDKA